MLRRDRHLCIRYRFKRFPLIVGRQDPVLKVVDFSQVFEAALGSQVDSIDVIDLRYPSGLAVRWKPSKSGI